MTVPVTFICEWYPRPPIAKRIVVDLLLHSGQYNRTANADDIRIVQAAGGRILYQFRVALLRAELDTGAVRALITGPGAIADAAYVVPDTLRLDAALQVFYARPITPADEAALRDLGASDLRRAPEPVLYAVAPDSLVPRIAALPRVQFVRATAVACATPD